MELSSGNIELPKFIGKDDHLELGQNCKVLGLHKNDNWHLDSKDMIIDDVRNDESYICGQNRIDMKQMPKDKGIRQAFFETMKLNGGPILCNFSDYKVTGIVIDQRIILRGDQLTSGLRFIDGPIVEGMIEGTKRLITQLFVSSGERVSIRCLANYFYLFVTILIQIPN